MQYPPPSFGFSVTASGAAAKFFRAAGANCLKTVLHARVVTAVGAQVQAAAMRVS